MLGAAESMTKWLLEGSAGVTIDDASQTLLFRNILHLADLHQIFLKELEQRIQESRDGDFICGDCFINFVPLLRCYTDYVNGHCQATTLLHHLNTDNSRFRAHQERSRADPTSRGQDLAACLITPVQRLPRYKMLLEELLKHTPSEHDDYDNLCVALELVKEVALHVNEQLRQAEKC
jgi:hypothetical protein